MVSKGITINLEKAQKLERVPLLLAKKKHNCSHAYQDIAWSSFGLRQDDNSEASDSTRKIRAPELVQNLSFRMTPINT